jgi:hypothetical protein
MADSQRSFETLINRFDNGLTLINGWADYDPTNPKIKKPALIAKVADIRTANALVETTKIILGNKQSARLLKTFTVYETAGERGTRSVVNVDCLEECILGIRDNLKSEELDVASLKAVEKIINKMRPVYPKKPKETDIAVDPRGRKRPSPSERSYAAAVGYGDSIVALITELGADYNPANANLSVANMTALVDDIRQLSKDVQVALKNYGDAVRARRTLYGPQGGLSDLTKLVKSHLASGEGRKQNPQYIEFDDAIKGR